MNKLWDCLNKWQRLYEYAKEKDIQGMIETARYLEGWNSSEFTIHPEINPPRIIVFFDGQPEIELSKNKLHKMFKRPVLLLRWVRKYRRYR